MTFEEAWARRKAQQNIVPIDSSDEQHFRHGWNAALEAAAFVCACRMIGGRAWNEAQANEAAIVQGCADAVRELEVEVKT